MKNFLLRKIAIPAAFFLAGLVASLVLLEVSLRIAAYLYVRSTTAPVPAARSNGSRITIGCFGDSFTEGGHSPYKERYPAQLQKMFDAAGENVDVINYGVCESNSTQTYRRLKQILESRHLDYVVLLTGATNRFNFIGFNDSSLMYFIKGLRISRLAHVFGIYVRDRVIRLQARRVARRQGFVFDKVGVVDWKPDSETSKLTGLKEQGRIRYSMSQARFAEALDILRQLQAAGERDPRIPVLMGECFEGLGDNSSAERIYRLTAKSHPGQGCLALGKYYARRGKYNAAERMLYEAIQHDNAREGYIELGLFYRNQKKYAQAEDAFKRARAFEPRMANRYLIKLYAESGQYAKAEATYDEALPQWDNGLLTDFALEYYAPRGKYADAMRCYLKALDQSMPPDMFPFYFMTSMFKLQSIYRGKDVLAVMDRAMARNPFLANEPTFQAYRTYYRDVKGWERKQKKWLKKDLEKMVALCRRKGVTLIIQNYPLPYAPANELLLSLAKRHQLPFIDQCTPFTALLARNGNAMYLQEDQNHCTEEGHRVMADNVFRMIQSLRAASEKGP